MKADLAFPNGRVHAPFTLRSILKQQTSIPQSNYSSIHFVLRVGLCACTLTTRSRTAGPCAVHYLFDVGLHSETANKHSFFKTQTGSLRTSNSVPRARDRLRCSAAFAFARVQQRASLLVLLLSRPDLVASALFHLRLCSLP